MVRMADPPKKRHEAVFLDRDDTISRIDTAQVAELGRDTRAEPPATHWEPATDN